MAKEKSNNNSKEKYNYSTANRGEIGQHLRNTRMSEKRKSYANSRTGRFGAATSRGVQALQEKQGITKRLYGIRGRPKGSLDKRYSKYGGVYGFRKVQSAQLRAQRLQQARNAQLSPQEQQILSRMRNNQNQNYPAGYDQYDKIMHVSQFANLPPEHVNVEKSLMKLGGGHAIAGDEIARQMEQEISGGGID